MANLITRTMKTTKVVVACLDTANMQSVEKTFTLPRAYSTDKEMWKAIGKHNTEENIFPCKVLSSAIEEKLFAVDEADFMAIAHEIPLRGVKEDANEAKAAPKKSK